MLHIQNNKITPITLFNASFFCDSSFATGCQILKVYCDINFCKEGNKNNLWVAVGGPTTSKKRQKFSLLKIIDDTIFGNDDQISKNKCRIN